MPFIDKGAVVRLVDTVGLTRPTNAIQPVLFVVIGAIFQGGGPAGLHLYGALLGMLLVHGAVTMWNDVEDIEIDRRNKVTSSLTTGRVSIATVRKWIVGQLFVAALLCLVLPWESAVLLVVCVALGWVYNASPLRLSRRPIASIAILALSYGILPLLIGAGLVGWTLESLYLSLAWGVSRVSLSLLKDYKDAVGDAQSNKRTFLLVFGHRAVRLWSVALALLSNVAVIVIVAKHVNDWSLLSYGGLVTVLGAAVIAWRLRLFTFDTYEQFNDIFHQSLWLQLIFDGVCLLWLISSLAS
jgi:4-hydroxybenzoate polyprenyltransferase